ncbi:MAG: ABC transporter permease [Planctomycetota bacterium]|jgi:ABC-type transport system involved in multi-copper enzyme maturation permease subunit
MITDLTNFAARFPSPLRLTGPIFDKELRVSSRRKRNYFLRFAYVLLLTAFITFTWIFTARIGGSASLVYQVSRMSETGKYITTTIIWFQFITIQLIAIVMLSTAISDEIYHRTLGLLMITPISSLQIVIGKLFSKLLQLVLLLAISMPLLAVIRVFGGVPWDYVVSSLCMTLTAAIFTGSVSLAFSITNRHSHSVIVRTVLVCFLFYIGPPIAVQIVQLAYQVRIATDATLFYVNPFIAMGFVTRNMVNPASAGLALSWPLHCVIMLGFSTLLLTFSTFCVRRAGLRQATGQAGMFLSRRERRKADGKLKTKTIFHTVSGRIRPVKGPPIIWKEIVQLWIKSSRLGAILTAILAVFILVFAYGYCAYKDILGHEETHIFFISVFFFFGLFRTATSAATSITSEKEAQTWPILLTTPLTEKNIVFDKIIGACLGGWAFWLLLVAHILVFSLTGVIPPAAVLPLGLLIVSSILLVSAVGVFFSSCFKRSSISATINLILFFSFTAPVCCPLPLPTYLVSPIFAAIMILGVTGGWSGIERPIRGTGLGWEWFGAFLMSGLALVVLVAIYLSLALGAFAIAVTNIRRRSL